MSCTSRGCHPSLRASEPSANGAVGHATIIDGWVPVGTAWHAWHAWKSTGRPEMRQSIPALLGRGRARECLNLVARPCLSCRTDQTKRRLPEIRIDPQEQAARCRSYVQIVRSGRDGPS